jgi:hypothetical protein
MTESMRALMTKSPGAESLTDIMRTSLTQGLRVASEGKY